MKRIMLCSILLMLAASGLHAQSEAPCNCYLLDEYYDFDQPLTEDCYHLVGTVTVPSGYTLTIDPGTRIFADEDASLVIAQGAYIIAQGAYNNPIVFTTDQSPSSRTPGYWKGITIAGSAVNNLSGDVLTLQRNGGNISGGDNVDTDSSGVMQYVQILYAGGAASGEEEVNGLTLNSVGSKTILDHIQVGYSASDGFAFLGGTVDAKYLVAYDNKLNDLTTKYGYRGRVQFGLSVRLDANAHDALGSNGLLSMNDSTGSSNTPVTRPVFSNMSFIAPGHCENEPHADLEYAVKFMLNSEARIYNSVLSGWNTGFRIENNTTIQNANDNNTLLFDANTFFGNGTDYSHDGSWSLTGCEVTMAKWLGFGSSSCMTLNQTLGSGLGYDASICDDYCEDPVSFTIGSTDLDEPYYEFDDLQNEFFTVASYRGAVLASDWSEDWTDWCPQEKIYCEPAMRKALQEKSSGFMIMPNPASGMASILFNAAQAGMSTITVVDNLGRTVRTIMHLIHSEGNQSVPLDLKGLQTGVYSVQLRTENGLMHTGKLLVK